MNMCYNCHSDSYDWFDTEYGYDLVKCKGCALLYVNPRPEDQYISKAATLGQHQREKDQLVTGRYQRSKIDGYLKVLRDIYPNCELERGNINWLDIGCGFGEFIETIENYTKKKCFIMGVDPNQDKILSAKKRNLNVSTANPDDLDKKFDYISLLNVYSHLPDPPMFLTGIKKNLKKNGELLLQTGHTSHIPKELQPRPYDLPDHLSFANKEIVVSILQRIGFEIIDVRMYRSSIYPRYYEILKIAKLLVKVFIRRGEKLSHLHPKHPNTDMYIRCRLRA